jgi:MFS superfamily sulfate permease-like transporter
MDSRINTMRHFQRAGLPRDQVAGLGLFALLVPQDMAYAELAGLPAITSIYITFVCLARAYSRTGIETRIAGDIGRNDTCAQAIGDFAIAYADQTESDYHALVEAVKSGHLPA